MKIRHALLSILSLALISCSTQTEPTPQPGTEEKNDDLDNNGKKDDEKDDNKKDDGNKKDDKKEDEKKDDDKKDDDDPYVNTTNWPNDIWNDMKTYLGGEVIPYVKLGKPDVMFGEWKGNGDSTYGYHETYYEIITGLNAYEETTIDTFETTYKAANWDVTKDEKGATATLESKHLTVKLKSVTSIYSDNYVYLDIYYDEPYDSTTMTAWTSEINSNIQTYVDNHSIPFIYLGSTNLYSFAPTKNNGTTALTIRAENGSWNDQIITNAATILEADKWECTESSNNYSKVLSAKKIFEDNCTVSLRIGAMQTKTTNASKPEIVVSLEEGYNPTGYTNPSDWDNIYIYEYDEHDIPDIYLGTKNPTLYKLSDNRYMTFTGKDWNDQILTDAKAKLSADNWTYEDATISEHNGLIAYKKFADDCRLIIQIGYESVYNSTPVMYVSIEKGLKDSTLTDWDADTKKAITDNLGSDVTIPYIYLGDDDIKTTWNSNAKRFEITTESVTEYNSDPALSAVSAFKKAKWTITKEEWTYKGFSMNAVYNTEDGSEYTASIEASSYYGPRLFISYKEAFVEPQSGTTWPISVSNDMTTNLKGYTLPYVYLGTMNPTSEWDSEEMELEVKGGFWNSKVLTIFKTALSADTTTSWTFADGTDSCVATGKNTTLGYEFTAKLSRDTLYNLSKIYISYKKIVAKDTEGPWSDSILNTMKTNMHNHEAPFVYLGTNEPKARTFISTYQKLEIRGDEGVWDDTTYDSAKKNLTAAGFIVDDIEKSSTRYIMGYKFFDDGCAMRIEVFHYVYEYDDGDDYYTEDYPLMRIYFGTSYTASSSTAWSSTNQSELDSCFGTNEGSYKLPYLNTGATEMTAKYNSKKSSVELSLPYGTAKTDSLTIVLNMIKTLKEADSGWKFEFTPGYENYHNVTGSLTRSDGSVISAHIYSMPSSNTYIDLTYTAATAK